MSAAAAAPPPERLQVIGLVSGGKDSMWALCETRRLGHAIVCLANLRPPLPGEGAAGGGDGAAADPDELDSMLVQTVGHTCVPAIAACLTPDDGGEGGTPLVRRVTRGRAVCTALGYPPPPPHGAAAAAGAGAAAATSAPSAASSSSPDAPEEDEVEDLALLLRECVQRFPQANAVVCGAVLSHYQRLRVEAVCRRLALQPLAWLWGRGQRGLLADMVSGGVEAVLVKVAAFGLSASMLGRPVAALRAEFARLGDLVGLNECGEGGEYETITLDCPLFESRRVVLGQTRVVEAAGGAARGSGAAAHLAVIECGTELKPAAAARSRLLDGEGERVASAQVKQSAMAAFGAADAAGAASSSPAVDSAFCDAVESTSGLGAVPLAPEGRIVCVAAVTAGATSCALAESLADEARRAFVALRRRLEQAGVKLADVCFVHLCEGAAACASRSPATFKRPCLGLPPRAVPPHSNALTVSPFPHLLLPQTLRTCGTLQM